LLLSSYIIRSVLTLLSVISVFITSIIYNPIISDSTQSNSVLLQENELPVTRSGNTAINALIYRTNSVFELSKAYELYTSESSKDITFSMQTINETDYFFTLRSKLLSGERVDLFTFSHRSEFDSLREYIKDLSGNEWAHNAYGASAGITANEEGAILGVPYSLEAVGFIINQDIFDYAEIPMLEIRSLDDLTNAFLKLNEKIISGELSEIFPELEAITEFPALDKNFLERCFSDIILSGTFKSAGDAAFMPSLSIAETQSGEEILKLMMRFSSSRNDWGRSMGVTNNMQLESFSNGRVAVILQNTGSYNRILDLNPSMKGRVSLIPVPLIDFETPAVYTGAPFYWAVNASSGEKEADGAVDFLKWLYTSDSGAAYFSGEIKELSPFLYSAHDTGIVLHRQILSYIRADMCLPQIHNGLPGGWARNVLSVNIQNYITERDTTWQDVIASCEAGWNAD